MPYPILDVQDWEEFKNDLQPTTRRRKYDIPKRLRVTRAPVGISTTLDLHGKTVQNAYQQTYDFLSYHAMHKTQSVLIITGRGTTGKALIKNEFESWLKTPKFNHFIRNFTWQNSGGAIRILLKNK